MVALLFPVSFWWLVHNAFEDRADVDWPVCVAAVALLVPGLSGGRSDVALPIISEVLCGCLIDAQSMPKPKALPRPTKQSILPKRPTESGRPDTCVTGQSAQ